MPVATQDRQPVPDAVDLYRVRDDLAESYHPANAFERMLLSQMAQFWLRLQRALDAEARYLQSHDILDAIAGDFKTYRAVTRFVAECDRAWRSAKWNLEKAQTTRLRTDTSSPNARRRPIELPSTTATATATANSELPYPTPVPAGESVRAGRPVPSPSG